MTRHPAPMPDAPRPADVGPEFAVATPQPADVGPEFAVVTPEPADVGPEAAVQPEVTDSRSEVRSAAEAAATTEPALLDPAPVTRAERRAHRRLASGSGPGDRANRGLLVVLGLLVAAAGAGEVLLAEGVVHWWTPGRLDRTLTGDAVGAPDLAAGVAMAVCLVLTVLGLRWAWSQVRPVSDGPRLGTVRMLEGARGRTTVGSGTLGRAASADVRSLPGVLDARVRVQSVRPEARLVVAVELALDADIRAVLAGVDRAADQLARVVGSEGSHADVRLRFGRSETPARTARPR